MKKTIPCLLALLFTPGCLVIKHDFTMPNGFRDKGSVATFMAASAAEKVRTSTRSTNYLHSSSAAEIDSKGDTEFIKALTAGIVAGMAEAAKKGSGVPVP